MKTIESFKNEKNQYSGLAKVSSLFTNRLIPKTEFSEFDILKEDGSQKKWKEFFKLINMNDSYYLLLTNKQDDIGFTLQEFEKIINYILASGSFEILTFEEYIPETIKNR